VEIVWSSHAKKQLKGAFEYYEEHASKKVAKRIAQGLVNRIIQIQKNPLSGFVEEQLKSRLYQYRFLVYRHYKIYYLVTAELVLIAALFDSRQDPNKISDLL